MEDTARRVMSAIFTADLARCYSFLGKAKKNPFHSLLLKSVVYGMVDYLIEKDFNCFVFLIVYVSCRHALLHC